MLRDPFGLAQRVVSGTGTDEVLVLPRLLPVKATALSSASRTDCSESKDVTGKSRFFTTCQTPAASRSTAR